MDAELRPYLDSLARQLKLDSRTQHDIVLELQGHLEDKVRDLQESGLPRSEALAQAARYLGRPDLIARSMYSVHSRGSWREVLLGTVPHLLLAALFALHLWTRYLLLVVVLIGVTLVALRGWRRGNPKWSYSWIGYLMAAPALSWLMAVVAVAYGAWSFLTTGGLPLTPPLYLLIIAYVPFSLWIMATVVVPLIRQDWLIASLSALPFPFLTTWFLFFNSQGGLWGDDKSRLHETDGDRALVFLALAVTTAVFLKLGHRLLKIGLLTLATALMISFTVVAIPVGFGVLAAALIILASVAFLFSPAVLMARLDKREGAAPFVPGDEAVTPWSPDAT